ncbi:MAG TPA: zinc-dependent metalloprotease, partial [Aquabacterium sp.]|nr:zinc-dependent metalloprotease [Aquabacterium sp.]
PLPAEQQRAALTLLLDEFLSPRALNLPPALQRQLAPDYFERGEGVLDANGLMIQTDFSVADQLARLQRDVLGSLMNEALAERLLDNIDKSRDREPQPLTVRELHRRVREAIWSPPGPRIDATREATASWRRNLQRDHVNRLSLGILRGGTRADVRAQLRQQARLLVEQLRRSSRGSDPDGTAQAHRRDCLDTLQRALDASVVRSTP